jgi:hypothetical protein
MGHMKDSIEFAHAELRELKEEADKSKRTNEISSEIQGGINYHY